MRDVCTLGYFVGNMLVYVSLFIQYTLYKLGLDIYGLPIPPYHTNGRIPWDWLRYKSPGSSGEVPMALPGYFERVQILLYLR